nr:MAG TPA: S-adenosylmethionine decarboxylase [Caudoviricetes sp.]
MKAEIFNDRFWVGETNPEKVKNKLDTLLSESNLNVLDFTEHYFTPQGYTALWLLSESHLAVHTFPEEQKSYIELSSCNGGKSKVFLEKLNQQFNDVFIKRA